MRRADRLFQIVQLLRTRALVTAATLASELEVSERTIYRDVHDLQKCGLPIDGEAGVGYALARDIDLPPLMFTREELETLVLALRMVRAFGGRELARDARSVLIKVEGVVPDDLRSRLDQVDLYVPDSPMAPERTALVGPLRNAIRDRNKVRVRYVRADGQASQRSVRPLALSFWGASWMLTAWCELRDDFRNFRPDRIEDLEILGETFPEEEGRDFATFLRRIKGESP